MINAYLVVRGENSVGHEPGYVIIDGFQYLGPARAYAERFVGMYGPLFKQVAVDRWEAPGVFVHVISQELK